MRTVKEDNVRLLRRILVSYNDFKQAVDISSHILRAKLHRVYPEKDRHILQALNCAMIIAYARPFSGNRGSKTMLPGLPERFLNGLAAGELVLHKIIVKDRNELLAHSDHSAWHLRLCVIRSHGHSTLVPLHQDVRAPLDKSTRRCSRKWRTSLWRPSLRNVALLRRSYLTYCRPYRLRMVASRAMNRLGDTADGSVDRGAGTPPEVAGRWGLCVSKL